MADPAVCAFLTKVLCGQGGRLPRAELPGHVAGLPEAQLRQLLEEDAPERFLLAPAPPGGAPGRCVLAASAVRLCQRMQCARDDACPRLHLCKLNLLGRCRVR